MLVVYIELTKDEDPKQIFDTLNSAGEALTDVDLIRNEVFSRVGEDDAQFSKAWRLRETQWQPLERLLGDTFVEYVFPYALTCDSNIKKSKVYSELCSKWDGWSSEKIIQELARHSRFYLSVKGAINKQVKVVPPQQPPLLVHPAELTPDKDVQVRLHRLRRMGKGLPSSTYPFLFLLFEAYKSEQISKAKYVACIDLLEAFLVRRAFVGIEPTGLHAVFKSMWDKSGGEPEKFVEVLRSNKTLQIPTTEEFSQSILEGDLYNKSIAPYLVFEYEKSFGGGDPLPDEYNIRERLTLDHVMPQTVTSYASWGITPETHKKLLHTWANLVPLTPEANSEKGNMEWIETRSFYEDKAIFKSTRDLAKSYETWTEADIRRRAEVLLAWAKNRWVM